MGMERTKSGVRMTAGVGAVDLQEFGGGIDASEFEDVAEARAASTRRCRWRRGPTECRARFGVKKARPLPVHSRVAGTVCCGSFWRSARVNWSGLDTRPVRLRR